MQLLREKNKLQLKDDTLFIFVMGEEFFVGFYKKKQSPLSAYIKVTTEMELNINEVRQKTLRWGNYLG
jgi:hypothetical protein